MPLLAALLAAAWRPAAAGAAPQASDDARLARLGHQQQIRSVADLQRAIYTEMRMMSNTQSGGDACVRLLTASGTVGCAAGRAAVQGRLLRLEALPPDADDYPGV